MSALQRPQVRFHLVALCCMSSRLSLPCFLSAIQLSCQKMEVQKPQKYLKKQTNSKAKLYFKPSYLYSLLSLNRHHSRILLLWFASNSHKEYSYIICYISVSKIQRIQCSDYIIVPTGHINFILHCVIKFRWLYCHGLEPQCVAKSEKHITTASVLNSHMTPTIYRKKKDRKRTAACEGFSCHRNILSIYCKVLFTVVKILQSS